MTPEEMQQVLAEQMRQQREAQMRAAMMGGATGADPNQRQEQYRGRQAQQKYAIIAAVEINHGGFSYNGDIPWYYPEDFKHFKEQTMGHICIMGRNTYEDINKRLGEKAKDSVLPDRKCFVVSKTLTELPNATVIPNIRHVEFYTEDTDNPVYIIGGRRLFIEGIAIADELHLTIVNKEVDCDMFFPIKTVGNKFKVDSVKDTENPEIKFFKFVRK